MYEYPVEYIPFLAQTHASCISSLTRTLHDGVESLCISSLVHSLAIQSMVSCISSLIHPLASQSKVSCINSLVHPLASQSKVSCIASVVHCVRNELRWKISRTRISYILSLVSLRYDTLSSCSILVSKCFDAAVVYLRPATLDAHPQHQPSPLSLMDTAPLDIIPPSEHLDPLSYDEPQSVLSYRGVMHYLLKFCEILFSFLDAHAL